jgi:hypothetical protein
MSKGATTDPRQLAVLYRRLDRRLASIPTNGGHNADRALLALAARLDRGAAEQAKPEKKELIPALADCPRV